MVDALAFTSMIAILLLRPQVSLDAGSAYDGGVAPGVAVVLGSPRCSRSRA